MNKLVVLSMVHVQKANYKSELLPCPPVMYAVLLQAVHRIRLTSTTPKNLHCKDVHEQPCRSQGLISVSGCKVVAFPAGG